VRPDFSRRLADQVIGVSQTYFVPLEDQQLIETFVTLSDGVFPNNDQIEARCNATVCTPVNTFVSVTISYDDTIVLW
jgi:hypothetical protein